MSEGAKDLSGFDQEKLEALVEIMVLAASADGEFQAEERERLEHALASLAPGRLGSGHLRAPLELANQVMAADGLLRTSERELILEAAEALEIERDTAADMVRAAGA